MILVCVFIGVALLIGYIQSVAWINRIGWDTVSYLELAELIRQQNWDLAISPYWSPLYPLLFAMMSLISPSILMERVLLCIYQYLCFVMFCVASVWFWKGTLEVHKHFCHSENTKPLPKVALIVLMGSVSLISSLVVGDLAVKGPDMLAAALYLAASAAMLSCLYKKVGTLHTALIGVLMGLTYLTKAFFISWLAPALVLMTLLHKKYELDAKKQIAMYATALITIALYVAPISMSLGHLSFGESGKYQIMFCSTDQILPMVPMVHGSQETLHPSRIIFENPRVYEFATPFDVTYPPWFNPHYWNEGIRAKTDWNLYKAMLAEKAGTLFWGFGIYAVLLHVCLCIASRKLWPYSLSRFLVVSPIVVTSMICMGLLLFLSAAVGRYFMGLIAPLFAGMIICCKSDEHAHPTKSLLAVSSIMLIAFLLKSLLHTYFAFPVMGASLSKIAGGKLPVPEVEAHSATANKLAELGIKPQDRIARVARDEGGEFYWMRLAGVRVVAECVDVDGFLKAPAEKREEIYRKLKDLGVKAIVFDWTNRKPGPAPEPAEPGWQRVSDTHNFVKILE